MENIKTIEPSKFTWDNYYGRFWSVNDLGKIKYDIYTDKQILNINKGIKVIGVCQSNKLSIRPREKGFAIMFVDLEFNCEGWIHLPDIRNLEVKEYEQNTME